jgi:hypothetical protein
MTWKYTEPRVVSQIDISPVPFHTTGEMDVDEALQVPCVLMYWHDVDDKFVPVHHFSVFQSSPSKCVISSTEPAKEWQVDFLARFSSNIICVPYQLSCPFIIYV